MTGRARTVVLGGTGYLGSEVVAAFAETAGGSTSGQVVAVGRTAARPADPPGPGRVEAVRRDLSAPGSAADLVAGADVVVHLVAPSDPTSSWRTTGDGAELRLLTEVLDAVTGSPRSGDLPPLVMVASTVRPAPAEGRPVPAPSAHEERKRALEELLATAQGRVRTAALRLSTVYGRGAGGSGPGVVASMVRRAVQGEPLTVWEGAADCRRNLLHVRDAAAAFVRAASATGPAPVAQQWSVGGADHLSVRGLAELVAAEVAEVTGRLVPVESAPAPDWAVPGDFRDVVVDAEPFARAAGWRPGTSLRAGVRDLVPLVQSAAQRRSDR